MVDLAKQAFSTANYDLAAEIYERKIVENGPSAALYLGLGDSYVLCGYFGKAFDAYTKAFRVGHVCSEELMHLVNALSSSMSRGSEDTGDSKHPIPSDPFSCGSCRCFLYEPVSITCGHTFCKACLEKQDKKLCKICDAKIQRGSLKINVLLSNISKSWFSSELRSVKLKFEGNEHFQKSSFSEAIELYTEALHLSPNNHLIASNRCYAYLSQQKYREALQDAEYCITLKPDWAKGYFRKAIALSGLNQHEGAALAFLQCLSLDSDVNAAKVSLAQSLHKLLSPSENEVLKHSHLHAGGAPHHQHTNPLLHALRMGANYEGGEASGHGSSGRDDVMQMLTCAVRHSTQENWERSARWWSQHQSRKPAHSKLGDSTDESSHALIRKCNSAPCLIVTADPQSRYTQETCGQSLAPVHRSPATSRPHMAASAPPGTDRSHSADSLHALQARPHQGHQHRSTTTSSVHWSRDRYVKQELLNKEDFDCALCFRLLYHPVTTPCGHIFCRECLDRCLDHTATCPLCKSSLLEYLAERRSAVTEAVEQILHVYFPKEFEERHKMYEEEMAQVARLCGPEKADIPVFVCTVAYPQVPCPLHVFEPKYRLMIRQCMESGLRQFGMVISLSTNESEFADYGTMLEIRDLQYFPDGRSVVDTIGGQRFKVLERDQRDGYNTAKVEFIKDEAIVGERLQEVSQLHEQVFKEAQSWFSGLMDVPRQRILSHFGDFPTVEENFLHLTNGPTWHWWLIAVLPLDSRVQLAILAMTSLKQRLLAIKRVLTFVRGNQPL